MEAVSGGTRLSRGGIQAAGAFAVWGGPVSVLNESEERQAPPRPQDLVSDGRVHSAVYTDPAIFATEMDRIFHRTWVYAAHESELPRTGDFRSVTIGAQPVILVRQRDGTIRGFFNRCRHRAAVVCHDDAGSARAFQCAYHGWTYALDGRLTGVPMAARYPESFSRDDLPLMPVPRIDDYRGFLFASLSSDGPSLREHLGRVVDLLDEFIAVSPTQELVAFPGKQRSGYRGNWKFSLENSVDGYHPGFVHRTSLPPVVLRAYKEIGAPGVTREVDGHAFLDSRADGAIHRDGTAGGGFFLGIFPNLIVLRSHLRVVVPIAVDRTEIHVTVMRLGGVPDEVNVARLRNHEECFGPAGTVWPDDAEIFRRNQVAAGAGTDRWIVLSRGLGAEETDAGVSTGSMTDEVPQRAFWRHWLSQMTDTSVAIAGELVP